MEVKGNERAIEGAKVGSGTGSDGGAVVSEGSASGSGSGREWMLQQLESKVEYNVYNWAVNDMKDA
jgi:hypothetical protein